jgi:hypothetical protein
MVPVLVAVGRHRARYISTMKQAKKGIRESLNDHKGLSYGEFTTTRAASVTERRRAERVTPLPSTRNGRLTPGEGLNSRN